MNEAAAYFDYLLDFVLVFLDFSFMVQTIV
jgi:hypothetical protein